MSEKLISRSPDLTRLRDEGYEIEIKEGYLVVHEVPYVTSGREVARGKVVSALELSGEQTKSPQDHQIWFSGEQPCDHNGNPLVGVGHSPSTSVLYAGLEVHRRFSNKPPGGYADHHAKVTRYIEIFQNHAKAIDPKADARTFRVIQSSDEESVFMYTDSAASRAAIVNISKKLAMRKVAIIGLGGTGSYVLDLVAKAPAFEIHLFDGDDFLQHNAFRAPGAASIEELETHPKKVNYFASRYKPMRRGIVPHDYYIEESNVAELSGFDFVFVCVDKPAVRKLLFDFFTMEKIPFVDSGMELELIEDAQQLVGTCRVTMGSPGRSDHFSRHVSFAPYSGDDLYQSNIQVADLNALCAVLSVIKWKKHCTFYQDCYEEHQSAYAINAHQLTREEMSSSEAP